jgi:hypothetical protein
MGVPDHSTTCVWDTAKGELLGEWAEFREPPHKGANPYREPDAVLFTADGKGLLTASDFGIRLREIPTGKERQLYNPENGNERVLGNYHLAATSAGSAVAIASRARATVQLWDYTTGRVVREFKEGDGPINKLSGNTIALSPDGRLLVSGETQDIVFWDVATGERLGVIREPSTGHCAYAFSPNGRLLASAGTLSKSVKVWDVFTRKEVAAFEGHEAPATCVAFSPDGSMLASGSRDTTILLWDLRKIELPAAAEAPDPAERDKLWDRLKSNDANGAWRAAYALIAGGDGAVDLLKARLKPVPDVDAKRVGQLLADLDAQDPKVRDAASSELAGMADRAEAQLRQALEGKPSAEVRARVQRLLDSISPLPTGAAQIRDDRALYVLEQINSEKAREHLERLARGAAVARLTRDGKAALDRLKHQEAARNAAARAGQ